MPRVMITGHSVGNEFDLCQACNFDYEWLLRYPSVLLWVDKIVLTKTTWDSILYQATDDHPLSKSVSLIFEIVNSSGLLEIIDPLEFLPEDIGEVIVPQVKNDMEAMAAKFPDAVKLTRDDKVPEQIIIDGVEYCGPYIYSVYSSLLLAKVLEAECLFDSRVLKYTNYKFGITPMPVGLRDKKLQCFHNLFESLFPNEPLLPEYVYFIGRSSGSKSCSNCAGETRCSDSYLHTVEVQTRKALSMRNYDEIESGRQLMDRIVERRKDADIDPVEVKNEFLQECQRLSHRNRKAFSKIKYWCSLSMLMSVPFTVAGLLTQTPFLTAAGAGSMGLSAGLKHLMDYLQEKYSWAVYFNKAHEKGNKAFFLPPPTSK